MRPAIVPATSLHADATNLFQVAATDEPLGQPAVVPRRGGCFSSARFLQLSEECRTRLNVGVKNEEL
jgi:hypothetical protein